ncbi:MAG: DUF998 domain-containing protein [Promethearchaeota archaeon]
MISTKWPISGFTAIIIFCVFTFIAIIVSPTPLTALNNNLSSLGDFYDNPNGALFFNLGMVFSGLFCIFLYYGLYYSFLEKNSHSLMNIQIIAGLLNSFALIMAGIFSETMETYSIHEFWSLVIFITFLPILFCISTILLEYPKYKKIAYYGFIVALIDFIFLIMLMFSGIETNIPIFEWFSVFSYIGWIGWLSLKIELRELLANQ